MNQPYLGQESAGTAYPQTSGGLHQPSPGATVPASWFEPCLPLPQLWGPLSSGLACFAAGPLAVRQIEFCVCHWSCRGQALAPDWTQRPAMRVCFMQAIACIVYSFGRCTATATKRALTSCTMQHGLVLILDMTFRCR